VYIAKEKGVLGDFYDQRLEVIDFYHDLSRRIARMRLLGTAHWTKEDYELAFAIKAGYIRIPHGPLYHPDSYKFDADTNASIKRGLFSVRRWVGPVGGLPLRKNQDPFPDVPNPDLRGLHYKDDGTTFGQANQAGQRAAIALPSFGANAAYTANFREPAIAGL
jgi:hypothetical protein